MSAPTQDTTNYPNAKRTRPEGTKKHIIAYVFSLILTFLAFAVVMAGELSSGFVYTLLVALAIVQVFVQMAFWMHMKDRGHAFAIIGILTGVIVVITCVIMALFWTWW